MSPQFHSWKNPQFSFMCSFSRSIKPRLGVAIIIDNVSTPGSESDVAALHDAFEVHAYRNCDSKVTYRSMNWKKSSPFFIFCSFTLQVNYFRSHNV